MTATFDEDAALRGLLAPLAAVEPVTRESRHVRRRWTIAAALAAAALAAVGIAAAEGLDPFAGIGAADHPAGSSDQLEPAIAAEIARLNAEGPDRGPPGKLVAASARLVSQLGSGRRIYVISTTTNSLCVLIQEQPGTTEDSAIGCGSPLSQAQPTTEMSVQARPDTPPLSFGVAKDNVVSVSFQAGGVETTVPVTDNVWAYEGSSGILRSLTVHFSDGSEETLGHG
jgi:hypothetical protein